MNPLPVDHIVQVLKQRVPSIQAVYLYGSFASGQSTDASDVDIGLLLPPVLSKQTSFTELLEIQQELEDEIGRTVDLINMRSSSSVLQFEIVNTGQRIFTSNPLDVDLYELLAISLYQKLVKERHEIVEEGLKTGFYPL